jgi:two-component system chemotaxis response regulator CheB
MPGHDIIVVGTSAGGHEALRTLVGALPADLPAAVFIVMHLSPQSPGVLPRMLARAGPLSAAHALDGEEIRSGRIYIAPPDHHLVLERGRVRVTRGPRENRFRPAVDPLFRSAAQTYGPRVVGVILTGALDDGTAGLWNVKARGGVTVVQEPREAFASSMPLSALRYVKVDYRLPLPEIASLLVRLAHEEARARENTPMDPEMKVETQIALEDKAMEIGLPSLGELTPYTCPECHGTLLQLKTGGILRFRCHTGHAFSVNSLMSELTASIEDTLWNALRAVEESTLLMRHLARHLRDLGDLPRAEAFARQAEQTYRQVDLIRTAVMKQVDLSPVELCEENPDCSSEEEK